MLVGIYDVHGRRYQHMSLTDTQIKSIKFEDKAIKLSDGKGLYLLVNKTGKYFRYNYRYAGKQKTLALGVYPETSLKKARERLDEARKLLADGIDPSEAKKNFKLGLLDSAENSFEKVAKDWHIRQTPKWTPGHCAAVWRKLEKDVLPWLGNKPINTITPKEMLLVLRRIEARGKHETAHKTKRICSQIFTYAIIEGKVERNPCSDLQGALTPVVNNNYPTITNPKEVGTLLQLIDEYKGSHIVRYALKLAPLVFVRPGELRQAEWSEIDFEKKLWKIPGEKMKMKTPHLVPLSTQAIAILKEIYPLTSKSRYVFHSERTFDRPMSDNTLNAALRKIGYSKDEMVAHGFRAMASTLLHENKWNTEYIERQLAHSERNKVKAAYNHAEYLEERTKMMQWWADYLDGLKKVKS